MIISTHLAISNSMSSFVPKCWLNWQILLATFNEFHRQRWDHQSVHTCPPLNEPHSLPKGNPGNIHEADSTEKHRHEKQISARLFTFFY